MENRLHVVHTASWFTSYLKHILSVSYHRATELSKILTRMAATGKGCLTSPILDTSHSGFGWFVGFRGCGVYFNFVFSMDFSFDFFSP